MNTVNTKILIMGIVLPVVFSLVLGLLLFIAAGTVFWFYGWIFLISLFIFEIALSMWLLRHDPGLLEERTSFKSGQPSRDKAIVILSFIFIGIWMISMPLDVVRFHWSQMPTWLHLVGVIVFLSFSYLTYLTYRENPYLSGVVRIQEDRDKR